MLLCGLLVLWLLSVLPMLVAVFHALVLALELLASDDPKQPPRIDDVGALHTQH